MWLSYVDRVSEWTGKAGGWLCIILMVEIMYDTLARYLFNAPTGWSYDISYMLYGAAFMMGTPWTLLVDKHVRIDILHGKMSAKSKAIAEAVGYIVFFFPPLGALLYVTGAAALDSWKMLERSGETVWNPPIYPLKTVLFLAIALLLAQGIAQFVRSITDIRK
jgi:TRAP-type mannitol/chloroaromatic compound transport system permease small subunit